MRAAPRPWVEYIDRSGGSDVCWNWTGYRNRDGYGEVTVDRKTRRAHRLAYMEWVGPIPEGLCVLHSCDNPPCCNPAHLRVGTNAENTADRDARGRGKFYMREMHGSKTHCVQGHPLEDPNLYRVTDAKGRTRRTCRTCALAATKRYRERKKWAA